MAFGHFLYYRKVLHFKIRKKINCTKIVQFKSDNQNDNLKDIESIFKIIIIEVVILSEEIMHIKQIRIILNKLCCHSLGRILNIFLPEFP